MKSGQFLHQSTILKDIDKTTSDPISMNCCRDSKKQKRKVTLQERSPLRMIKRSETLFLKKSPSE